MKFQEFCQSKSDIFRIIQVCGCVFWENLLKMDLAKQRFCSAIFLLLSREKHHFQILIEHRNKDNRSYV